jgi:hypothetical protein
MELSDFWRELAKEFRALPDPDGLLYVKWKSERGSPFEWSVETTKVVWGGDSARAQFIVLAARGGAEVDNPNNRDLLSAWFDALTKETMTTEFGSSAETLEDGRPARTWGKIHRICEASATFCHKLTYRALEAKRIAKAEQDQNDDPRQRPLIVQRRETLKSIRQVHTGLCEEIPEAFVRDTLAGEYGVKPEDVTVQQIQDTLPVFIGHYLSAKIVFSALSNLRMLGLTIEISENTAATIIAQLSIIDGKLHQGAYRDDKFRGLFARKHLYDAYHAIAGAIVSAETSDDVLENMIPAMVHAFKVKEGWSPHMDYETLKSALRGTVTEWKGKRLLMATELKEAREKDAEISEARVEAVAAIEGKAGFVDSLECENLRDSYLDGFIEKIVILDICWAAEQRYREWRRWINGGHKKGSKADRAFRAILTSGKRPKEYRPEPRPPKWQ